MRSVHEGIPVLESGCFLLLSFTSASELLELLPHSFLRFFSGPAEGKRAASRKPHLLLLLQARSDRSGLLLRLLIISLIILLSESQL